MVGWGLSKKYGWEFYLLATFWHSLINYSAVLNQIRMLDLIRVEILIAVISLIAFGVALWVRWMRGKVSPEQ